MSLALAAVEQPATTSQHSEYTSPKHNSPPDCETRPPIVLEAGEMLNANRGRVTSRDTTQTTWGQRPHTLGQDLALSSRAQLDRFLPVTKIVELRSTGQMRTSAPTRAACRIISCMAALPEPSSILSFEDARHLVEEHAAHLRPHGKELVELLEGAGQVLAEPVLADRNFPPFPRAMRDGYAVRAADLSQPSRDPRSNRRNQSRRAHRRYSHAARRARPRPS